MGWSVRIQARSAPSRPRERRRLKSWRAARPGAERQRHLADPAGAPAPDPQAAHGRRRHCRAVHNGDLVADQASAHTQRVGQRRRDCGRYNGAHRHQCLRKRCKEENDADATLGHDEVESAGGFIMIANRMLGRSPGH